MRRRFCPYLLLILLWLAAPVRAAETDLDFRLLIDVTRSMERHDPENQRAQLVRLFGGLLPAGARAGVWTYGRYVEMIVPWGRVDANWRRSVVAGADRIHANAELSHLETALARASVGWSETGADDRRSLLIVTDSPLAVSRDHERNQQSRERVLATALPELVRAGVELHVIAVGDEVDAALLRRLAVASGGSYRELDDTRRLLPAALDVYARIANAEFGGALGEAFEVDSEADGITLLLFREAGEPSSPLLIPPNSPAIGADQPRGHAWTAGANFDLVRISQPEAGTWRMNVNPAAGSRMLVSSGLGLNLAEIPAFLAPGDELEIAAELFRDGRQIRKNSYLRFVEFSVVHADPDGKREEYAMEHHPDREYKGRYIFLPPGPLSEGRHRFEVSATTRRYRRAHLLEVEVRAPAEVEVAPAEAAGIFNLRVRAREEFLMPDGISAEARVMAPNGSRSSPVFQPALGGWLQARVETDQEGLYRATVSISAQGHDQRIVEIELPEIAMLGSPPPPVTLPASAEAVVTDEAVVAGLERRRLGFIVLGVNLFLIVGAVIGWLLLRRRSKQDEFALDDEDLGIEP